MLHRIAVRVWDKWQTVQFGKSSNLLQLTMSLWVIVPFFVSQWNSYSLTCFLPTSNDISRALPVKIEFESWFISSYWLFPPPIEKWYFGTMVYFELSMLNFPCLINFMFVSCYISVAILWFLIIEITPIVTRIGTMTHYYSIIVWC